MADLKRIYAAADEETTLYELEPFAINGTRNTKEPRNRGRLTGKNYPHISSIPRRFER